MKTEQRRLARTIRREEGAPIKEIARRVGVAPSSVSLWVRDIKLTPGQERELLRRNPAYNRQLSGTAKQAANRRAERIAYQQDGRRLALEGEARHIAGCMLYWAEGEKDQMPCGFPTQTPKWCGSSCRLTKHLSTWRTRRSKSRATCSPTTSNGSVRSNGIWLEVAQLPEQSLCKSYVNVYSKHSKKKRTNRLPYGTVRVTVCRTRVIQSIYGSIQEYAGFDRESWLD